jgi:hypothetical protein
MMRQQISHTPTIEGKNLATRGSNSLTDLAARIRRATANFPGESPAQIARHAEIERHYERYYAWPAYKGKKFERGSPPLIARKRLRELERLFRWRYGAHLPHDDAGLEDLEIAAHHIAHMGGEIVEHIIAWAATWMPQLPRERAEALAERVKIEPRRFKAKTLGWRLGLTDKERTQLGITTIEAIDVTPQERAERRKQMARERAARSYAKRRAGLPPKPEAMCRAKPWEALGISESTWRRRGKPMPDRKPSAVQVF